MAASFSAWTLYHNCHITNSFYRRMMHEEDERPPNKKSHAYHFSITYNGCDFCLLTPYALFALPKCLFKGWRLKFRGFIYLRSCSSHCNWNWSALHKNEHKKDAIHKKLLNLLCIVYIRYHVSTKTLTNTGSRLCILGGSNDPDTMRASFQGRNDALVMQERKRGKRECLADIRLQANSRQI